MTKAWRWLFRKSNALIEAERKRDQNIAAIQQRHADEVDEWEEMKDRYIQTGRWSTK